MKVVDLFSGCGGLSLGFEKAKYEVVAAIDNWDAAIEVYKANFNHPVFQQDLTDEAATVEIIKEFHPEMIVGGPPCQDFSSAGKRDESLGRADLTYHYANIVCQVKPNWFVMENVARIKKSHILREVVQQFQDEGYGITGAILDASLCGVPQARTRFFLIGELGGDNNALLETLTHNLAKKQMTIRDYLGESLGLKYYYRHPRNYNRRGIFSIDEPSPTVRGVNRPVPAGYKQHNGDPKEANLSSVRPLTTIERSYIQTFPKSYIFNGTKTGLEQMIGNAVPVNLAKYIALSIKQYINNKDKNIKPLLSLFPELNVNNFILPVRALCTPSPSQPSRLYV